MKKTLLIVISLLLAFSLAIILFIVGLETTRKNMPEKEETKETQKFRTDEEKTNKKKTEDAVVDSNGYEEEDEEDNSEKIEVSEDKKGIVLDNSETKSDEKEDEDKASENKPEETTEKWYRVRKSAGDAKSQKGAFKNLEGAKAEADKYKNEGYKVYDGNNCIYTP